MLHNHILYLTLTFSFCPFFAFALPAFHSSAEERKPRKIDDDDDN